MKFFAIHIAIIIIFIEISYSQEKENPCESYNFLYEMAQIPKFDSAKYSVIARYCLNHNIGWVLLHYEQVIPLEIKIPPKKECLRYSFGGEISLEPDRTFFNQMFGGAGSCFSYSFSHQGNEECKAKIIKGCNGCTKDFALGYCFNEERDDVSYLFDKYLPIKRDLGISCDGEKIPIHVSENEYIYISGICTKEQLKRIEESKKNEKSKK
jgi:hypothetical protein